MFFKDSKKSRWIALFIFVSILIHFLLIFLFKEAAKHWEMAKEEPKPIMINLQQIKELPIVDVPKPEKEEVPDQASAQGLYNQKVAEETVAPPTPAVPATPPAQKPEPKQEEPQPKPVERPKHTMEELYGAKPEEKTERIPGIPESNDRPQMRNDSDFLPNYKFGGKTYLNTQANPNVAYYVELKRKFKLTWNPVSALRGQNNLVARGQVSVVLGVTVDARGNLANLVVIRSSGLDRYDAEGLRTIRDSAPFSSPPAQLLEGDGTLNMAWTFVVYL